MYAKIDKRIEQINAQLFERIKTLAAKAVNQEHIFAGFCMGMGSYSFSVECIEQDEDGSEYEIAEEMEPAEILSRYATKTEKLLKEIGFIIDEYDSTFKLTGQGLRITKLPDQNIKIDLDW